MARYQDQIFDEYKRPVEGAEIYVFTPPGDLVDLTDDGGFELANPVRSDHDGIFYFNAVDGAYELEIRFSGQLEYRQDISIGYVAGMGLPGPPGELIVAADRVELATFTPVVGTAAYLSEAGRTGMFVFVTGDHSAKVAADARQGLFVKSDIAPLTTGAWVRQFDGAANVMWWGAVADGVTNTAPALVAALETLYALATPTNGYGPAARRLYIPQSKAHYYMGTTTLALKGYITIEGDSSGIPSGNGSVLKWSAGCHGITMLRYGTYPFSDTEGPAKLKGLALIGGYTGANPGEWHGIKQRLPLTLEDCFIGDWQGDGVNAYATSLGGGDTEGNCNGSVYTRCFLGGNKNGLFFKGADANACSIYSCRGFFNRESNFYDESFLGNTYIQCEAAGAAGTYGYRFVGANGCDTVLNCYSEGGLEPSVFRSRSVVIGGLHGAGISGVAAYLSADQGFLNTRGGITSRSTDSSTSFQAGHNAPGYFWAMGYNLWPNNYWMRGDNDSVLCRFGDLDIWPVYGWTTDTDPHDPHTFIMRKFLLGGSAFGNRSVAYTDALPTSSAATGAVRFNAAFASIANPIGWWKDAGTPTTWTAVYGLGAPAAAVANAAPLTSADAVKATGNPTKAEFNAFVTQFNNLRDDLAATRTQLNLALARLRAQNVVLP